MIFLILVRSEIDIMDSINYKDPNPRLYPAYVRDYNRMNQILHIREALTRGGFWDQETINRFVELFSKTIKITSFEVDLTSQSIFIHINSKKSVLNKLQNYRAESMYFYSIIGNVMLQLIPMYKNKFIDCIYYNYGLTMVQINELYNQIVTDQFCLCNLFNVQLISDSIVQIIF